MVWNNLNSLMFLFGFRGRINRQRYLLGLLIQYLAIALLAIFIQALGFDNTTKSNAILLPIVVLFLWSNLVISIKRFHDRNKSGWWIALFWLAPGTIAVLYTLGVWNVQVAAIAIAVAGTCIYVELIFLRGSVGSNCFGPDPLDISPAPLTQNIIHRLTQAVVIFAAIVIIGILHSISNSDNPLAEGVLMIIIAWVIFPYILLFLASRRQSCSARDNAILAASIGLTLTGLSLDYAYLVGLPRVGESSIIPLVLISIMPLCQTTFVIVFLLILRRLFPIKPPSLLAASG